MGDYQQQPILLRKFVSDLQTQTKSPSWMHHPPPAFFNFRLARSTIASTPSFLPSFDSNPLTQTASKDKKSPAKDDHTKSLQKSKKNPNPCYGSRSVEQGGT
jgi:hypothetical protein